MANIDYSIKDVEKLVKVDGKIKNVKIARLTAPGENFRSLVLRVDFEVEKDGHSTTLNAIAKLLPPGERLEFNAQVMTSEIKWYTKIVTLLRNFAEEHGIQGMDFFPDYYGSRYSLNPEKDQADTESVLLLKNLIFEGFKNEDRYKGFDLMAAKAIIKKMALFHSVPLAIKFNKPELFKVLQDYLEGNRSGGPGKGPNKDNKPSKSPHNLILEEMINMSECTPYVTKLKELMGRPQGPHTWHNVGIEPWNTTVHANFWINNVMINPQEGRETLVKIVDFQTCSYGSYAKDLLFFILTSVDNDVTTKYMDDLLRLYYEEFTSVLKKAHVAVELTYTAFLKEVQRVASESEVSHALFFTTVVFGKKAADMDEGVEEEFNVLRHMDETIKEMNQHHKDKLVVIASEAVYRNWI